MLKNVTPCFLDTTPLLASTKQIFQNITYLTLPGWGRGVGQKGPPTSSPFVTLTNVEVSPQNFLTLTLVLTLFCHIGVNVQGHT